MDQLTQIIYDALPEFDKCFSTNTSIGYWRVSSMYSTTMSSFAASAQRDVLRFNKHFNELEFVPGWRHIPLLFQLKYSHDDWCWRNGETVDNVHVVNETYAASLVFGYIIPIKPGQALAYKLRTGSTLPMTRESSAEYLAKHLDDYITRNEMTNHDSNTAITLSDWKLTCKSEINAILSRLSKGPRPKKEKK